MSTPPPGARLLAELQASIAAEEAAPRPPAPVTRTVTLPGLAPGAVYLVSVPKDLGCAPHVVQLGGQVGG